MSLSLAGHRNMGACAGWKGPASPLKCPLSGAALVSRGPFLSGLNGYLEYAGITLGVAVLCSETGSLKQVRVCKCSKKIVLHFETELQFKTVVYPPKSILLFKWKSTEELEFEHKLDPSGMPYKCIQDLHCENYDEF